MILRVADWLEKDGMAALVHDGLAALEQYLAKHAEFQRLYPEEL